MKKVSLSVLAMVLAVLLCACNMTFDGYFYKLDDARMDKKVYAQYDYLHTVEQEGLIVDFIFAGNMLHIYKIDCRQSGGKNQYKVSSMFSTPVAQYLTELDTNEAPKWYSTGGIPSKDQHKVEFCFSDSEIADEGAKGFTFEYDEATYWLYYKIQ